MNDSIKRKKKRKFSSMMESIGKAGNTMTLPQQEVLVRQKAARVAEKTGVPVQKAEAAIWADLHKKGLIAPDDVPARIAKIEKRQAATQPPRTSAEIKIDKLAQEIAKRDNCSLARATDTAWKENSGLYTRFLEEYNSDEFQERVRKAEMSTYIQEKSLFDDEECDEDDEDCEDEMDKGKGKTKCKCGSIGKSGARFCSNCGAKL